MKAIRLSFFRMLTCMRRDLMLFAACLSPVLAGLLFRFAIPPLETALRGWLCKPEILSPYYALIDLCFAMLSPPPCSASPRPWSLWRKQMEGLTPQNRQLPYIVSAAMIYLYAKI